MARFTASSTAVDDPVTASRRTLLSASLYHVRHAERIRSLAPGVLSSDRRAAAAAAIRSTVASASFSSADARNHALVATAVPTLTISAGLVLSGRSRLVW